MIMKKKVIKLSFFAGFIVLMYALVLLLAPKSALAVFDKKNGDSCPGQENEWTWECPNPTVKGTCGGSDCIGYNLKCVDGVWKDQSVGAGVCTNECGTCSGGSSSSSCQNPSGNEGDTRYDCSPATAASCASDACVGIPKRCQGGQWVSMNDQGECTTECTNCSRTSPTARPTTRPTTATTPRPTSGGSTSRPTPTSGASSGGGSSSCSLNSYTIADSCSSCITSKDSGLAQGIKNLGSQNGQNWSSCSDNKLIAKWCTDINKSGCDEYKKGDCKSACSGDGGGTSSDGVTTHYRISETSFGRYDEDGNNPQWVPYTNNDGSEVVSFQYKLKDPAPGQEFTIFVQFKDDNQTENSKKYSVVEHRTIKFVGGDPVITSTSCGFDPSGDGTLVTLIGSNFGIHEDQGSGEVKINGQTAEIVSWTSEEVDQTPSATPTATASATVTPSPTSTATSGAQLSWSSKLVLGAKTTRSRIAAKVKSKLAGRIPLQLKLDDGRTTSATCTVNTTTVEFTAKVSCRPSGDFSASDVSIAVTEATSGAKPIIRTKIRLDKGGTPPSDFVPVLEKAKKYNLLIKAPKTVARKVEFTTQDGSNVLSTIILPIGDIAPAGNSDGKINALDKSELVREWSTSGDTAKPGDFNMDGRVNSMDWSCMRENINKEDEGTL